MLFGIDYSLTHIIFHYFIAILRNTYIVRNPGYDTESPVLSEVVP